MSEEDGGRLGRLAQDSGHLVDLRVLLGLDLARAQDGEVDLEGLPARLDQVLVLREAGVDVVGLVVEVFYKKL